MSIDRRWLRLLAILFAFAMVAASCGGSSGDGTGDTASETDGSGSTDDGDGGDSETTETTSFDDRAAAQQEGEDENSKEEEEAAAKEEAEADSSGPKRGGNLAISWGSDIGSLDPIASSSFNTQYRIGRVYQRMLTFDAGPGIGYTQQILKPELATEWDIADDGLTYTFKLREGIVFHDVAPVNGREFDSGDVKATFDAILAEGHQSNLLARVTSVDAPDKYTVVLTLSEPYAPLINNMASHFLWILPKEAFDESSGYDRTSMAIGTGPFMLGDREVDVETNLIKNPDYWDLAADGEPLPYLDSIRISVISDTAQAIAAFKAGEIDIVTNGIPLDLLDQLKKDYPEGIYGEDIDAGMGQIGVNMNREPFNDLRVRQAISYAIDRDGMGDAIRGGGTVPSNVAPALSDFALPEDERREYLNYDPEKAKKLLADAGFPDGLDATMIATDRYGALYTQQTEWVIEDLEAVGINVTLDMLDYSTYFGSRWPDVEYDLQFGPQTPFLEPDEWLRGQMGTGEGRNWYNISEPELDELLDEQLGMTDPAARQEKIKEIQRWVFENLMNPIPVWTYFTRWNYSPIVQDFYRHASYGLVSMEHTWLDE